MDWYPHKIDAYDGKTRTLTLAEDGAYCRLLRWYYKHEEPLPDDDAELAAICRCSIEEWMAVSAKVKRYFVTRDAPTGYVLSTTVLVHEVCKAVLFSQNLRRKDWKSRQEKLRKNNGLEGVTRDTPVGHAVVTLPEERRGEEIREESKKESLEAAIAPKAKRGSRIDQNWTVSEKGSGYAKDRGLNPKTIKAVAEQFRDHWTASAGKGSVALDWEAKWRTWVNNHIGFHGTGDWPADGGSRSQKNNGAGQGIIAARDRILAKAGLFRGDADQVREKANQRPEDDFGGAGYRGTVIDDAEWSRGPDATDPVADDDPRTSGQRDRPGGGV